MMIQDKRQKTKDTNDYNDNDQICCLGTTLSRTHSSEKDVHVVCQLKCPRNDINILHIYLIYHITS